MLKKKSILGIRKKSILCRFNKIDTIIVVQPITELDEINLDKKLRFNTGKEFVDIDKILLYGSINFNDENDINLILDKNIIDDDMINNRAYSNVNYKTGEIETINNVYKMYEEINPIKWLKLHYCYIGNPERIIIYKSKLKYF